MLSWEEAMALSMDSTPIEDTFKISVNRALIRKLSLMSESYRGSWVPLIRARASHKCAHVHI